MNTTQIPNDKAERTETFTLSRKGQSDYRLMTELLDVVSNSILFHEITSIEPIYNEVGLVLTIKYNTYL